MENLPPFGTAIAHIVAPTQQLYLKLLTENKAAILSTKKETFSYGANPRQMLDVYYPPDGSSSGSPLLLFFYGGGFVRGERILPHVEEGLVYANLGHFFSQLGYTTIVPDYRLVPDAEYPTGGEDVLASLKWADARFGDLNRDIYLMGNSAGAVHISTLLLAEDISSQMSGLIRPVGGLKGAILLSPPCSYHESPEARRPVLEHYFGPEIESRSPTGLLEIFEKSGAIFSVPMLVMTSSMDPGDEILNPAKEFCKLGHRIASRTSMAMFQEKVATGHNHVSTIWALGTGRKADEKWAVEAHGWMRSFGTKH